MKNTKTPRHTLVYSRLGFSGADIAGQKLQADNHSGNCLAMIKKVALAFVDGTLKQSDIVYSANDYRFVIRANDVTSKGVLGYYSDQLKKQFKKLGYESKPTQKDGVYTKWSIEKLPPANEDSKDSSEPDNSQDTCIDSVVSGIDHDVIHDRLEIMLKSGVTPEHLIREILSQSMETEKQADFLMSIAGDLDQALPVEVTDNPLLKKQAA